MDDHFGTIARATTPESRELAIALEWNDGGLLRSRLLGEEAGMGDGSPFVKPEILHHSQHRPPIVQTPA